MNIWVSRKITSTLLIISFSTLLFGQNKGHEISIKLEGVKDTICFMAGYYGSKQYYKDTAEVNSQGVMVFKGPEPLPHGIYSIVYPDKSNYFEFVVKEQNFSLETKKSDPVKNMKTKNTEENKYFYEYLNYINGKQREAEPFRKVVQDSTKSDDEKKEEKKELGRIDKEVQEFKEKFITDHPSLFISKVFLTGEDPKIPETPLLENGAKDSLFPYRYYRDHFWDNVDFSDDGLLRTPVFHGRLEKYMKKMTLQIPDSINAAADRVVTKARAHKEMFKYVVHWITNTFETSKIMGMDAVFVHMAENYYLTGEAHWVDSVTYDKIKERAEKLGPLLIGKKAPNIILQDSTEAKWINMHNIEADYTILYIWDPDCGHCKKATPKLVEFYNENKKKRSFEVYAVSTEFENDKWRKYIKDNKLPWINVSDNPEVNKNAAKYIHLTTLESLNFRSTYDVYSTPQVYILDKNKKIILKRIGIEQIHEFFEMEWAKSN